MSDRPTLPRDATVALISEVERLAQSCREAWQELWDGWRRNFGYSKPVRCVAQDACGVSSFALCDVLWSIGPDLGWRVAAGRFRAEDGWHDHAWVEGRINRRRLIVDITADQFGAAPVIVALSDVRYRKTVVDDELPGWRELAGWHVELWAELVIWCQGNGIARSGRNQRCQLIA